MMMKMKKMMMVVCVCLMSLGGFSAASSLSCRWMDQKFTQHSEDSLKLIKTMANNSTNTTENTVDFPNELYSQAAKASAADKLSFTVQVLQEMAALFEEDYSSASWEENTVQNFLQVVTQQADKLQSCTGGHKKKNKKLEMYFKRLSDHVLKQMSHSADAWELVRKELIKHLERAHLLASSLNN